MKKILLLSFLLTFIFTQKTSATPVDIKPISPTEKKIQSKKKEKKKRFFARMTEKIMKRRMGKMIKKMKLSPSDCDRIITTDGEELEVVIISIGSERVRYKKCDFQNGPTHSIRKEDILVIKYADGKKEVLTDIDELKNNQKESIKTSNQEKENYREYWGIGFAIGILLGLFGLLILAIALKGEKRKIALRGALAGILAVFLLVITLLLLLLRSA